MIFQVVRKKETKWMKNLRDNNIFRRFPDKTNEKYGKTHRKGAENHIKGAVPARPGEGTI